MRVVLCTECKYYTKPDTGGVDYSCTAPQNRRKMQTKSTGVKYFLSRRPEEINKNQDCRWFQDSFFRRIL